MAAFDTMIAEIWAARFLANLDKMLVYGNTINRDFQADLEYGNIVHADKMGPVAIGDYVKNVNMDPPETLESTQTDLTIDQQKYWNFAIDSIEEAQTRPSLMDEAMERSAYGMANVVDMHLASMYASAGSDIGVVGTPVTPDVDDIYQYLTLAAQNLDELNVPNDGSRYFVMNAAGIKLLRDAGEFLVATPLGDDMRVKGALPGGMVSSSFIGTAGAGFNIWMSNNTAASGASTSIWQYGHPMAVSMAESVNEIVGYNPELRFGEAVKGLYVYGADVMQPNALGAMYTTL